jgi:hypothetical protein
MLISVILVIQQNKWENLVGGYMKEKVKNIESGEVLMILLEERNAKNDTATDKSLMKVRNKCADGYYNLHIQMWMSTLFE